ncbi:endonuclease/exonuclease/phosphatase family protein [Isoptericola sp. b490]|uniref:endonuclease/exonuclease/phosphatase family protein n=1 Tax=Actinotalea lenta TaxID=3064654 RepID=UPI0027129834|nr:endonuclease/exonuclease/phosphatase family protein [Isoptericola sp. b490]MDO8120286.1 endonuclease/exonuclease/phosphatase family protein [Isoptericola sp. b490]
MNGPLLRRVLAAVGALAVAALAVWPQVFGLSGVPVIANAIAVRGLMATGALLLALAAGVVLLVRRRRAPAAGRKATRTWAWVVVWCVLVAVGHVAVLTARGLSGVTGAEPAPAGPGRTVVLELNTQGKVPAAALAGLVAERRADVVALPETSRATAERAQAMLAAQGLHYRVLAEVLSGGTNPSTAALVAQHLGRYRVVQRGPAATFAVAGSGPPLTFVHTTAPVDPTLTRWRTSTRAAVAACSSRPEGIVVGDFNATLDHPAFDLLDGCVDAASVAGDAGVATWPTALPRWLGTPIDHVLVDPSVWAVERAAVLRPPHGADHRALEVVLTPAG